MKKKAPQNEVPVVDQVILQRAKAALRTDRPPSLDTCTVCGAEAAPNSTEKLCWVCRRLKISAWRDSDQQPNVQE